MVIMKTEQIAENAIILVKTVKMEQDVLNVIMAYMLLQLMDYVQEAASQDAKNVKMEPVATSVILLSFICKMELIFNV